MKHKNRIQTTPEVLAGKPVIKGTRLSVEFILELLASGWSEEEILKNYPQLQKEDIKAAVEYSKKFSNFKTNWSKYDKKSKMDS